MRITNPAKLEALAVSGDSFLELTQAAAIVGTSIVTADNNEDRMAWAWHGQAVLVEIVRRLHSEAGEPIPSVVVR